MHKKRFKQKSSLKTYIFSIARNKAIDFLRHSGKYKYFNSTIGEDDIEDFENLEDKVLKKEKMQRVREGLEKLNDDYKRIIHLIYFEDLSQAEAAKVLGKNKKQTDNLIYRAKKALKDALEKEGFSYENF